MAGCTKGTGPRIERMYAKALHWWCASHQLNLVIVGSCTVPLIRNMIGTTDQVHVLRDQEVHVISTCTCVQYMYLRFSKLIITYMFNLFR